MVLLVGLLDKWSLGRFKDHEIVCGLGQLGQFLAINSAKNNKVVAITTDPTPEIKTICANNKISLVVGNASDSSVLEEARIHQAAEVYICTRSDNLNLEIVHAIQKVREAEPQTVQADLNCFVSIEDLYLTDLILTHEDYSKSKARMQVNAFNNYKTVARSLWQSLLGMAVSNELCFPLKPDNPNTAHIILVGYGLEPEAIALQLANQAHFANGTKTRMTIIAEQLVEKDWAATNSIVGASLERLNRVLDFNKISARPSSLEAEKIISESASQSETLTTVIVCGSDDSENLRLALHFNKQLGGRENTTTPVFVRLKESRGLNDFLELEENIKTELGQVHGFGIFEKTFTDKNILSVGLNKRARAIHDLYRKNNHTSTDPEANKKWDELREYVKEANRAPAEHITVKCLAIGCDISSGLIPSSKLIEANMEVLAHMEHERWMAQKILHGWTYGEVTDNKRMTHKNLVRWDELSEVEKEKDRSQVRAIPKLLADGESIN